MREIPISLWPPRESFPELICDAVVVVAFNAAACVPFALQICVVLSSSVEGFLGLTLIILKGFLPVVP